LSNLLSDYEATRTCENYSRKKCPDTTFWVLNHKSFKDWLELRTSHCLWLTGKVGSGKTLLTTTVIEQLLETPRERNDPVAHFFYSSTYMSRLKAIDLFQSYSKQLLDHLSSVEAPFPSKIASCLRQFYSPEALPPNFDELIDKIFIPLGKLLPQTVYVVDGLDECEPAEIQMVLKVVRRCNLRIFISGRENLNVEHCVPNSSVIRISEEHANEDIRQFIEWKIKGKMLERKITENGSLVQNIKSTLVSKADRM
jgi:hypothetical protein